MCKASDSTHIHAAANGDDVELLKCLNKSVPELSRVVSLSIHHSKQDITGIAVMLTDGLKYGGVPCINGYHITSKLGWVFHRSERDVGLLAICVWIRISVCRVREQVADAAID